MIFSKWGKLYRSLHPIKSKGLLGFFTPSLFVIAALLIQLLMRQVVGGKVYLLFYPALFFGAIIGGFWPGLVATILASIFSWWYIFTPYTSSLENSDYNHLFAHIIFSGMGLVFSIFAEALHRSQNKERIAREEAERMSEKLEKREAERTQLLTKLETLDKLKSQFFANVSHELRTPLTLILGPVETFLAKNPQTESRPILEQVQRNSQLLLRHVNDLLDISKLEVGKAQVHYSEFDLVKTIKQIAANFEPITLEKQFQFTLDLPSSLIVQMDYDKFHRIFINLLSNAFKFTPIKGKICCSLRINDKTDGISTPQGILEVADSGLGIPESYREMIFDRYFQIEESTNRLSTRSTSVAFQ